MYGHLYLVYIYIYIFDEGSIVLNSTCKAICDPQKRTATMTATRPDPSSNKRLWSHSVPCQRGGAREVAVDRRPARVGDVRDGTLPARVVCEAAVPKAVIEDKQIARAQQWCYPRRHMAPQATSVEVRAWQVRKGVSKGVHVFGMA